MTSSAPEPFTIHIPDAQIAELHARLEATRWPQAPHGNAGWEWGANLEYMRGLVDYWRDGFDWRAQERRLNGFSYYIATLTAENGEEHLIHFVHERGSGSHPRPLILTHGWPSTFVEFIDVV